MRLFMRKDKRPKKIIIVKKEKKNPDDKRSMHIYTNFRLSPLDDVFKGIPFCDCPECESKIKKQSKEVLNFLEEIKRIEGISVVVFYKYFLWVDKELAFSWDDLEPKILELIKKIWLGPDIAKYNLQIKEKPFDGNDEAKICEMMGKLKNEMVASIFSDIKVGANESFFDMFPKKA